MRLFIEKFRRFTGLTRIGYLAVPVMVPLLVWASLGLFKPVPRGGPGKTAQPVQLAAAQPDAATEVDVEDRLRVYYRTVREEVPYDVIRRADSSQERGAQQVARRGATGSKEITVVDTYLDGKLVSSDQVGERILQPPVTEVVTYGTMDTASRGGQTFRFRRALYLRATAYTAGKESNPVGDGYTATGVPARRGIVAVDPSVLPLNTRLYVEGYGYAVAADTGGAIKGLRIDLCMDSLQEALDFGIRQVKVYVLE